MPGDDSRGVARAQRITDSNFKQQTQFRILAAHRARALPEILTL
jgi:hypothetical protein